MCKFESIENDYIRILKSQSYKQMPSVGLGIIGKSGAWVLFPLGVIFFKFLQPQSTQYSQILQNRDEKFY